MRRQMPVICFQVHLHGYRNLVLISENSKYAVNLHGRRSLRQNFSVHVVWTKVHFRKTSAQQNFLVHLVVTGVIPAVPARCSTTMFPLIAFLDGTKRTWPDFNVESSMDGMENIAEKKLKLLCA